MFDGCDDQLVPTRTHNIRKYYRMIAEVGSGTYGRVYKAECLRTHEYVALKKFESKDDKVKEDGFPITAVREIRLLKQLDHENVIKLREIIVSKPQPHNDFRGSTFLVFDYMDHDFAGLHRNKHEFSPRELKGVMLQILKGVQYLHSKKVIHRDLKIANILYNNEGYVKIADFGLARTLNPNNPKYTNKVVTLWYRAPEILLGAKEYTQQVDMWSVGCIFIELAVRENLLRGENEPRQLEKIYELCGGISPATWAEAEKLQHWKDMKPKKNYERKLIDALIERKKSIDPDLLDLLDKLMVLNPKKRYNVQQCLEHPFFSKEPLPFEPSEMSKIKEECHEALLKNVQSRNQVIASMKSNFLPRVDSSPSRLPPAVRLQYGQSQKQQQQQQQPTLQTSRSLNYSSTVAAAAAAAASSSSAQFVGAGHFDGRSRYANSQNSSGLQRANSASQTGNYNNQYGRPPRYNNNNSGQSQGNNYMSKKLSIDNNNDYPSIELHLNHQPKSGGGGDSSSSKLSSFQGLACLVQNQGVQNLIALDNNSNTSTSNNSAQKITIPTQNHHVNHLHGGDTEDGEMAEEERMFVSQMKRSGSSNPLAALASSLSISNTVAATATINSNSISETKLNQKRASPASQMLPGEPGLKKKLKEE